MREKKGRFAKHTAAWLRLSTQSVSNATQCLGNIATPCLRRIDARRRPAISQSLLVRCGIRGTIASAKGGSMGRRRPTPRPDRPKETRVSIPFRQIATVGSYIVKQHLTGRKRYPLVLMLEPLFRCNLACAGCGKIDYPDAILNKRISVEDALTSVDEVASRSSTRICRRSFKASSIAANSRSSAPMRSCSRRRSTTTSPVRISPGRSISMATRRCTTSRYRRKASTSAPCRR